MRFEWKLTIGSASFLAVVGVIYWYWAREPTGTACLIFSTCAYALIAAWFYLQYRRRHRIDRPEDRMDATQADGAGEIGFFPAASIWPAGMGLGAIFLGIGLIYGTWYFVIGGVLMFGAIAGFVVEAEARDEGPDDPGTGHPTDAVGPTTTESRESDISHFA